VSDTSDSFDFYFDNFGYPASSGTALTKLITAANIRSDSPTYWGRLTNNDNQSGSNLSYQVYDQNQNLVSDFDLPGNSSGFSAADINLSTMTVADYPSIYLKANFNDPAAILYDWSVNLQFAPATPTIDSSSLAYPNLSFTMSSTDADSDYLQYKVTICSDANLSVNCIEYDQSSSQTGWTGQNANSNTAYTSGSTASFSATNTLNYGATYYYKVSVKDPAGTDRWVDSTSGSETTNNQPSPPTDLLTEGQTNPSNVTDLTPEFSAIYRDPDASDQATAYQLQVSTYRNFYSSLWDSGKVSISNLDVDTRSSDISYSGPSLSYDGSTYFWRIRFYDSEDIVGYWSNNAQFTMNRLAGPSKCLLQRNPSTGQITVTWEDNNTLIDTFTIQRNVNNTGFVNLATGVNSSLRQYLDATSTLNNKYQYRIAVVYGGTTGDWCLTPILDPYNSQLNFSGLDLSGLNFE